ncbi:SAM-dependent methyltransferase [Mycobacterium sp. ACS4331]|uniref:SAM-dependent methyltransferase n=1 Tax=Mycobacterium sp. ACS4331 TaxID=1834121 RepID=UPI0007FCCF0B|nr:SAM-dependent methyltransferase [Mycobacterium sp. ACS4331]OBF15721.1 methyltransferase [Mycobacterium sp. ACS4331]
MARNAAAQTALGPMVLAAVEHNEPAQHRLVDDDLAAAFLPAALRALVTATRWSPLRSAFVKSSERSGPGLWASIACRKRLIDERLSDPLHEFDTVVILGAGLDTRAYRIARHSGMPVFEVDQPINVERKAAVVTRALGQVPDSVRLVPADFERDDLLETLRTHGYDPALRTFFVWEGVTQYLSPQAVRATLDGLRGAARGSQLIFTYIRQDFIDGTNRYGAEAVHRRFCGDKPLWHSGFDPERLHEQLAEHGWTLVEQAGPSYFRDTYIRPAGRTLAASAIEWTAHATLA